MNCPVCFRLLTDVLPRANFSCVFRSLILEKNLILQNKVTILEGNSGCSFEMRDASFSRGFFPILICFPWKASNKTSHLAIISIKSVEGSTNFPSPKKGQLPTFFTPIWH